MKTQLRHFFTSFALTIAPLDISAFEQTLENYDENTIVQTLESEIPELPINQITLISSGWDNFVADINDEWIFRFPRSTEFLAILSRETTLLKRLHEHVSMPIPNYEYIGAHTAYVGYRKIKGIELDDELYLAQPNKQEIADEVALFMTQMHNAVSAEEASLWGYRQYQIPHDWIENNLLGTIPEDTDRIVKEALRYAKEHPPTRFVLIHNDLHGGNLAFDPVTHRISGIFDFSDAVIADYTIEFGKLFNIHYDLALRTAETYAIMNNVPDPALPAAADFILRRGFYILNAREIGDSKRERTLLKMLRDFVPIWDDLFFRLHDSVSDERVAL